MSLCFARCSMLAISANARIFFFQQPIDMRKGIEGLSSFIENLFIGELTSGAYFVFINRSKDKMKVLYWDNDGFAIWWKRLERGSFRLLGIERDLIDRREFFMLLEGITPHRVQKRFKIS
jgi:transposase